MSEPNFCFECGRPLIEGKLCFECGRRIFGNKKEGDPK